MAIEIFFAAVWKPNRLFSQNFEDLYLYRLFSDVDKGFYVDVGAWHPSKDNISKIFYDNGWRGVNIEPLREAFELLQIERPNDFNLNVAVSDKAGPGHLAVLGDRPISSGQHFMTDMHENSDFEIPSNLSRSTLRPIQCTSLREVFEKYVSNTPVNFLKLDVEGFEYKALKGLKLKTLTKSSSPQVILLEATLPDTKLSAPHRCLCHEYLVSNGYSYLFFDGLNDYFCLSDLHEQFSAKMIPPNIFDRPSINCNDIFNNHSIIHGLRNELVSLQENLKDALAHCDEQENNIALAQQSIDDLRRQVYERESHLNKMREENIAEAERLIALEIELADVKGKRDAQTKEKINAQRTLEELKKQFSAKAAELEVQIKEKAAGTERVMALERELADVKSERDAQTKEKIDAQGTLEELKKQFSAKAAELEVQIKEKAAGTERVMALEGELADVKSERDAQTKEKIDAQNTLEELKQQFSAKAAELESQIKEKAVGTERMMALEGELTDLKENLKSLAMEKGKASQEADLAFNKLHELQEELEKAFLADQAKQKEIDELIQQRTAGAERVKCLEEKLASIKGERDTLKKEIGETREKSCLTILQLNQVQEELEHYFLKSREQDDLLRQHQEQSLEFKKIISKFAAAQQT
ncbi:FkbM family methyltransferase [Synechococcus sp. A10-1-5-9]|uniref:FkbM family methyltransferase n=1 Tax=Synechococcus sp. A10-1-5-9 TaxID=3392295 RepID=UPI0039EB21E5